MEKHKVLDLRPYVIAVLEKKYQVQCYFHESTVQLIRQYNDKKRERKMIWAPLANG